MAEIRSFRALHYNMEVIPDLSGVITQPYDKISPEMQARYYSLSPYNLARVIRSLPAGSQNNIYARAAADFQSWIQNNILVSEQKPALYPYHQEFEVPGQPGVRKTRRGFIGLCKLEPYSAGVVHRHEETLSGPKADRMELLKKTGAHFGQIFFLYSDPAGDVEGLLASHTKGAPWQQLTDEYATRHSVWRVSGEGEIARAAEMMRDKKLVIADGHHRYETALAYRDFRRAEGAGERAGYVMATFIPMEAPGLTILPTHRVVHSLPSFDWAKFATAAKAVFDWKETESAAALKDSGKALQEAMTAAGRERAALAVYARPGKLALLSLRPDFDLAQALPELSAAQRRLDVVVLHRLLLERALGIDAEAVRTEKNLRYVRGLGNAVGEVNSGAAQAAFLLNPTPVEAVREVAFGGGVMPQKSTDFYPKMLSGFTIYWLENPLGM
ncbi:MAG: DUF1015 domain-containing protein [Terriglobia bacterium]